MVIAKTRCRHHCAAPPVGLGGRADIKAGFALALSVGMGAIRAEENHSGFDMELLRQRGIDPRLAEYFSAAPRFTPGEHKVQLKVNGQARGAVIARFGSDGELCYDASFLAAAGLRSAGTSAGPADCSAFIQRFALTQVQLRSDIGEIELVVPVEALVAVPRDLSGFSTGGVAGVLNYELLGMANRFGGGSSRNTSANTEVGFNAGNWIVRSHQLYSATNGVSRFQHIDAYAQRTFAGIGAVAQLGQIQLSNPVLGAAQVTGVQLMNEQGLGQQGGRAVVEGIAQGPARVEVRQMNNLIYTTIVPGGVFVLRDVPRVNQRAELQVMVIEADGNHRQFSVSAAQAGVEDPGSGYTLGVGQLRNAPAEQASTIANAGWTGRIGRRASVSIGTMASPEYFSAGTSVGQRVGGGAQIRADLVSTRAASEGVKGIQSRISITQRLGAQWSVSAAVTRQTAGYRELLDSGDRTSGQQTAAYPRTQYSGSVGWSHQWLGSLNAGYARSTLFNGSTSSRANASWAKNHRGVAFSLTAERDLGHRGGPQDNNLATMGTALYATLSVPLGGGARFRTAYSDSHDRQRISTSFASTLNDTVSYRLGAERNLTSGRDGFSTGVSMQPRHAQVDLGYTGDGDREHSISTALRGGLVAYDGGVMTSIYPLSDTFALIKVGEVAGVKVDTSSGPVWTNGSGAAVVPRLNAYGRSNVEVVPESLPRNVDIGDGARQVMAARGAVERIDFSVIVTRRVLLQVHTASGAKLAPGASVVNDQNIPIGMVDQDGTVFVPNVINLGRLWVSGPDVPRCELHFELAPQADAQAYYETVPATCRAS